MTGERSRRESDGCGGISAGLLRGETGHDNRRAESTEAARRWAMERAALELSGEVGFARMTVAALVERSGSNLDRFYRTYGDKTRCYSAAYALGMEELAAGALRACAQEKQWADGLRVALVWLAELAAAEPVVLRGLLGEARAADPQTRQKREEVFERLSRAIDRARREADESRHSPPPLTARFVLWGIETSLLRVLDRPDASGRGAWLAGAIYVGVDLYLGGAAAREQVRLLGPAR
jgi:AcrR family transcriptional regulator